MLKNLKKKKKKMQILRVNSSRILTIKNAKFSEYYFYMNLNILGDFQFCISVKYKKNTNKKYDKTTYCT